MSSIDKRIRVFFYKMVDIHNMAKDEWRLRLAAKIKQSDKSLRAISLAIGKSEGYVHSVLKGHRSPRAEVLAQICAAVGTSVSYVLYGFDISAEEEEFLSLFSAASKPERDAVLTLLRSRTSSK